MSDHVSESHNSKTYKVIKNSFNVTSSSTFAVKKKSNKNVKRMLCKNIIKTGSCGYGSKCEYAHTLNEQIIDATRKQAWEILLSDTSLENVDIQSNYPLYQAFEELTKLCKQCRNNECIGGYNCDHGVFDEQYQICSQDLNYGACKNLSCNLVHLTHRNLKPWYTRPKELLDAVNTQIIKGTLLSEKFFTNSHQISVQDDETLSNFTNSSDEDDFYEDECNKSIFTK